MTERRKSSLAQTPSPCFSWHLFNLVTLEFNMWVCLTISVDLSFLFFLAVWSQFIVAIEQLRLNMYLLIFKTNFQSFFSTFKPCFLMIATIAAIDETKVQRSQRSYGNHSPAMAAITAIVATKIAEIDFSSISVIVAIIVIIWKPLSSDHSASQRPQIKNTRMHCVRSPFSKWLPTQTLRKQSTWHFLWKKYKNTTVFTWNFQRNRETSTRKSTAGKQSERNSI